MQRSESVSSLHEKGHLALRDGLARASVGWLIKAAAETPDSAEVLADLGAAHLALDSPGKAMAALKEAVRLDPACVGAHLTLADACQMTHQAGNAKRHLLKAYAALAKDRPLPPPPNLFHAAALAELAESYLDANKTDMARRLIELANAAHSDCAEAHAAKGRLLQTENQNDEAHDAYRRAVVINPGLTTACLRLAGILTERKQYDAAIECLLAASALPPGDTEVDLRLAELLRGQQRNDEAMAAFKRILDRHPENPDALRGLSAVLRDRRRYDEAMPLIERLVSREPGNAWAHVQRGNILARLGRASDAAAAYKAAQELESNLSGVAETLGIQLEKAGNLEGAVKAYAVAAAEHPSDGGRLMRVAELHAALGSAGEAVVWYRRAAQADPAAPGAQAGLARALLACGRWDEGLEKMEGFARQPGLRFPGWDGKPRKNEAVLVHTDGLTLPEEVLLMGAVARLRTRKIAVVVESSATLAPLLGRALPKIRVLARPQAETLGDSEISGGLHLAALFRRQPARSRSSANKPWLSLTPSRHKKTAPLVAVDVHGDMGAPLAALSGPNGWNWSPIPPIAAATDEEVSALAERLAAASAVVTDRELSAALAVAFGKPCVAIVPDGRRWPWLASNDMDPWGGRIVPLVRRGDASDSTRIMETLAAMIARPAKRSPLRLEAPLTGELELLDAIHRVPLLATQTAALKCTRMTQGFHNKTYRISAPTGESVLRLPKFPSQGWYFYMEERHNMSVAHSIGLSPEIFHFDTADGTMLIRFVEGRVLDHETFRDPRRLTMAAHAFRRLHSGPPFIGRYDIFRLVEKNYGRIGSMNDESLPALPTLADTIAGIRELLNANGVHPAPCHNDPIPSNFIERDENILLVDWQCSAMTDPHWEIGALSAQLNLPAELEAVLFAAYFGDTHQPGAARAALYKAVCWHYWLTLALAKKKEGLPENEWRDDFNNSLRRLNRFLASPGYAGLTERVRRYRDNPAWF